MQRRILFFLFLISIVAGCADKKTEPNVSIHGHAPALKNSIIVIEELEPLKSTYKDSIQVNSAGDFECQMFISEPGFYLLKANEEFSILLLIEVGEHIHIADTSQMFGTFIQLNGSPGSSLIQDFEEYMAQQQERVNELAEGYYLARENPDYESIKAKLDSTYSEYVTNHRDYVYQFFADNPSSLVNLLVLNRKFGVIDVIDEQRDYELFYRIDSSLQISYPDNKHSLDHHERVKVLKGNLFDEYVKEEKLQPGRKAPDVIMKDTLGNPISLKSYTGQQVILYFWAGWDAESRKDNRQLREIYPNLKSRDIEIIGISLDENEVVWKGAIRLDQLKWPQVCEMKGFYAQIKKDYNVPDKLPYYYVIDENQKIRFKHHQLDSILVQLN